MPSDPRTPTPRTPTQPAPTPPDALAPRLDRYADLLLRVGVNLQPGQRLLVRALTEAAPFVRTLVERAYRLGAPYVEVMWSDEGVTRARFLHAPDGTFAEVPGWRAQGQLALAEGGAAAISLVGDDPDLLAEADPERWSTFRRAWQEANRAYQRIAMSDGIAWCVAATVQGAWARKVFPDLPDDEAVARLWDAVLTTTRCDLPDPVAAWSAHDAELRRWRERLSARHYAAIRFHGPGTDLRVGLAEGHVWEGGSATSKAGVSFVPNMPTEEVFTAPHARDVDGVVRATMPLADGGSLIDDFELRFEGGRVVEARAGRGQAALDRILDTDEGARRLGEVALVPASSPVARTGVLFLETLFDENAASHIALGRAYPTTLAGGAEMSDEQTADAGLNDSMSHVDFMIGSDQMDVDGETASGTLEPVMRAGEWVA